MATTGSTFTLKYWVQSIYERLLTMGGGGDGAILDGADASVKATVKDLTNSNPVAVAIVDGSGNQVTSFGGTGGTSAGDEAAFTPGSTQGTPAMGVYEAAPTALTDGEIGLVGLTSDRAVRVSVTGAATETTLSAVGAELADKLDEVTFTGRIGEVGASPTANTVLDRLKTIAANILTTLAANITKLGGTNIDTNSGAKSAGTLRVVLATDQPALTNKLLVTPDSVALPAHQSVNVDQVAGTTPDTNSGAKSAGTLRVVLATDQPQLTNKLLVTPDANSQVDLNKIAGTTADANSGNKSAGTLRVVLATDQPALTNRLLTTPTGDVAHDGVDSGNPVKIGMRAIAHGTNPTAVAAADRTDWLANRAGVPFVVGGHPNIVTVEAAYTAAQTDTAIVTVSSGLKIVVTQFTQVCSNANTVNVGFRAGFGAANTPTTTGVVATHPGVAPGSGISRGDGGGILGIGADGEDLRITSDAPTTGSLRVLVSYYTVES